MKRLLFPLAIVGIVSAVALGLTNAFFSDTETSADNTFTAGAIDLKVDNTSYYNGVFNQATSWLASDLGPTNTATGTYKFFDFQDIKPGDWGEDTISLHVDTNDAWACYNVTLTSDDDNTCTEPENVDDPDCLTPSPVPDADLFDGELADNVEIAFWQDDGDNVYEEGEVLITQGLISEAVPELQGALADSQGGILGLNKQPMVGSETYYIAKAWCFGDLNLTPVPDNADTGPDVRNTGLVCNGTGLNNATQTDIVTGDISFSAIQARNNAAYVCTPPTVTPSVSVSPSPSPSASPTPTACLGQADFMLALDRSGSISASELTSLKTAANDFVNTLSPSLSGIHMGQDSFSTNATLNVHLTDSAATMHTAINALVSGGFTNLYESLLQSKNELDNPGDGHDRPDGTSKDYVVLITDGNPNRPTPDATARAQATAQANLIKAGGGTIYVVGVGGDVDTAYLQSIATDNDHYFPVANYSDLSTALNQIAHSCD